MSRLNWRQRLIAVAIGIAAAALQSIAPAPKTVHAASVGAPAACHEPVTRC